MAQGKKTDPAIKEECVLRYKNGETPKSLCNEYVLEIIDYLRWMEGLEWWERTAADRKDTERFVKEWNERNNK